MPQAFRRIYIHIPFCQRICHYCDFYVAPADRAEFARFYGAITDHVKRERDLWKGQPLKSIYIGGGTPSESPPDLLAKLLQEDFAAEMDSETEVTIEVNPASVTKEAISVWSRAGINRVSVGIQSTNDSVLQKLGRNHSRKEALQALELLSKNFSRVSGDLIYGIPDMKQEVLRSSITDLMDFELGHISAYTLTLKPAHFLFSQLPSGETTYEAALLIKDTLSSYGLNAYEASNFARPGHESNHNQAYWRGEPYLAFGPSAHGYDGLDSRWENIANWRQYCQRLAAGEPVSTEEKLSSDQLHMEFLLTRLRTSDGINLLEYEKHYPGQAARFRAEIPKLRASGFGHLEPEGFWRPSFQGLMLADAICENIIITNS